MVVIGSTLRCGKQLKSAIAATLGWVQSEKGSNVQLSTGTAQYCWIGRHQTPR